MTRSRAIHRMLAPRGNDGAAAIALFVLRVASGLFFMFTGIGKFLTFGSEVDHFAEFGIPWPSIAVVLAGLVEAVGGFLLVIGLLVRPVALALAATMAIAIATAGRELGGPFHLGVAPALLVLMLVLAWSGGTWRSIDALVLARR
ncbi:MAG: DoxX family protein [Actinomycetota bacterium]|nr:DoxX family protein [Actinomycetota bacterium]